MTLPGSLSSDIGRYVEALKRRFGADLVSVVLFGSWTRSEAKPGSDIDVLIVVRNLPRSRFERYGGLRDLAQEVSGEFAQAVAPILVSPEEARHVKPYYLGMLSGHLILRDADGFFAAVLERLRNRLAELGARRCIDEDGYEYWDLKPDWKPGDVVVPPRYRNDLRHVAVATVAGVDALVSWNFRHLVNLRTRRAVHAVNVRLGYALVEIVSPEEI